MNCPLWLQSCSCTSAGGNKAGKAEWCTSALHAVLSHSCSSCTAFPYKKYCSSSRWISLCWKHLHLNVHHPTRELTFICGVSVLNGSTRLCRCVSNTRRALPLLVLPAPLRKFAGPPIPIQLAVSFECYYYVLHLFGEGA